ncbi:MAG: alpha/beta hydrolase, partial [Oscillospiraceae bacterium]|nr:alpha/beta hydrolase [Oscillospiraceae bacterium]
MTMILILAGIAAVLAAGVLVAAYICYRMAFYAPPRKASTPNDPIEIPEGEVYEAFREPIERWIREIRALPHQEFSVQSFDGLTLYGKYYEYKPGAPIELMFHGYRGSAERDLSGGVQRCFQVGRSVLLVDQRCCGKSEGNTITFGVNEHRDCLTWLEFMCRHFGPDVKIILTGVSMGAATVLMAGGTALPKNVIGILADCGYSTARDIIGKEIRRMGIPEKLGYPFVK